MKHVSADIYVSPGFDQKQFSFSSNWGETQNVIYQGTVIYTAHTVLLSTGIYQMAVCFTYRRQDMNTEI